MRLAGGKAQARRRLACTQEFPFCHVWTPCGLRSTECGQKEVSRKLEESLGPSRDGEEGTHLLLTGSHTSIWRVLAPLLTAFWAKVGTALQGRLLRLRPLNGLAATGAVGQDTMEAVRAAIAAKFGVEESKEPGLHRN